MLTKEGVEEKLRHLKQEREALGSAWRKHHTHPRSSWGWAVYHREFQTAISRYEEEIQLWEDVLHHYNGTELEAYQ